MHKPTLFSAILALPLFASTVFAFGCKQHTFTQCEDGITHWYDPDDGQICDPLDCGGGRAPVKYNVPGCAAYTGTETRATSASYLSCWPFTTKTPSDTASPTGTEASVTGGAPSPTTAVTGTGSTTPVITPPPNQTGNVTPSAGGSGTGGAPAETPNAGGVLEGSLMVGAGAAIGALLLV
ncbi:hypothetical protein AJ78_00679 [Emergomyces pasteurianus Ep9510]|uniref:Uncharacterized protein n=1 Tax=Emergomyces pasteurianus Ep9510 TaxID=1447872 RepID=A0A1J9PSB8_9EURO|nr:hypothetical protein AJ78_00679 [Emergomyces pasteurianus Ep9510]